MIRSLILALPLVVFAASAADIDCNKAAAAAKYNEWAFITRSPFRRRNKSSMLLFHPGGKAVVIDRRATIE